MFNVKNRIAIVIGAGAVARRKIAALRDGGAIVRVISDGPPAAMDDLRQGGVDVLAHAYRAELLAGAMLVLACTDDRELNARIARDARRIGAVVNVADQPEDCDFFLPAVEHRGDVVLAVGTGGDSPALSAALRDLLARHLPEGIEDFAALLSDIRGELRQTVADGERRMEILRQLSALDTCRLFQQGGPTAVRLRLGQLLGDDEG